MSTHVKQRAWRGALAILAFVLAAGTVSLPAKGFSGGGGSRGASHSSGGFRSPSRSGGKSFSGSSGSRRSSTSRPSYDQEAGTARQHEISQGKFNLWRSSSAPHETPSFNPSLSETRTQRISSELGWRQPTGYYSERPAVVIYRDSYDNSFMRYVSLMWLFNHWNNVDRSRFDDSRVQDLEAKFRDLEAKGYKRDPGYNEPGVDPDLAYRKEAAYQGRHSMAWLLWGSLGAAFLAWGVWFVFVRRVPYAGA